MNSLVRAVTVGCEYRMLQGMTSYDRTLSCARAPSVTKRTDLQRPSISGRNYGKAAQNVLNKGIFRAIRQNSSADIQVAIKLGANVNRRGYPSTEAITKEFTETMIFMGIAGASLTYMNSSVPVIAATTACIFLYYDNSVTPLMAAAKVGNLECVKVLLSHGATNWQVNNEKKTANIIAFENGHYEIAKLIKQNSSDRKPRFFLTPFYIIWDHFTTKRPNIQMDIVESEISNKSPLQIAGSKSHTKDLL